MTTSFALRNDGRLWVPLLTAAAIVVMFAPPIALGFLATGASRGPVAGALTFAASAAWFLRAAWRAPMALTADGDALLVSRPRRADRFDASRIKRWAFTIPDGAPTRDPPTTNALLVVTFDEGTTFRGEATSDEARAIAAWFARHFPRAA